MFSNSLMRHLRRKGVSRRSTSPWRCQPTSVAIEPLERRLLLSALDPFSLTAGNVQIEGSATQVVAGTFDLVFNVPTDQSPMLSGYEVHLAVDPADSGVALTGASEAANAVFAGSAPGVFQVGNTINVSDFLSGPGQQIAITDGAGLATIAFEVQPNTVGLFNVVFTVVNLRDGDVNPVPLEETFDGMITVSLADVPPTASLSGFVWNDTNNNGVQDTGESGIAGSTVRLLGDTLRTLGETLTDDAGLYHFDMLPAGDYVIEFAGGAGLELTLSNVGNDATDSDATPPMGRTGVINLVNDQAIDHIDAGFVVAPEQNITTIDDDKNTADEKSFTFTDADGDETTVSIKGPGTLEIALVGGVTDNADISLLALAGTDPSKTTVTVKVKRGTGDGETSIARIEGTGVKLIDAKNSDLVGNTIELTGPLGELKIDDILDGADIILGGTSSDKFKLTADLVGNVNLTFPGLIDKLQVTNWADGSVHVDAAKSIKTKVDKNVTNSGAWGADLVLTGLDSSLKETLGSFSADGPVDGAAFNITGDVKSFVFKAALSNASFTVASAVGKFDAKGALTDVTMTFDEYGSVTATSWLRGGLTAAFGKSVETKGDKKSNDDGDITDVTVMFTGLTPGAKAKEAISKIKVAGSATHLTVDVEADHVGTIEVKNATTDSALTLADAVKTLKLGDVSDTDVTAGSTSTIDVVRWLGGAIALTDAKSIKTKGSKTVAGDFAPTSVTINAGGTSSVKNALGSVAIKGALSGAWTVTGVTGATKDSAASKIQADAIDADFIGHFMGDVGSLASKSVFDGFASAFHFSKIDVKTSMTGATIIAGGGASANTIGSFKTGGNVTGGTRIFVGVDPINGVFEDGDDLFKAGSANFIKSISIGGVAAPDSMFVAGAFPTMVAINKVKVDPLTDDRFTVS